MGVLDFLSDLSKASRKDELGLGGMRSLLGTRGAAPEGKRGDEMMSRTSSDSLPGYFDPETREYVPWYVDLFDGGGLNKSEGLLSDAQKVTTAVDMLNTNGAPVQRAGQMAPGLGSQLSDMEMANRNRVGVDPRNLGGAEGYGPMSARDPRNLGGAEGYGPIPTYASTQQGILPQDYAPAERYASSQQGVMPQMQDNMPVGAAKPRDSTLNTLRKNVYSVGPIEAMVNAYNNRPDIPLTQPYAGGDDTPRLSEMQTSMMQHPAFPQFVDIMKRMGNESVLQDPSQASFVFNNYLKQIGY
jgi:hypothetical protein